MEKKCIGFHSWDVDCPAHPNIGENADVMLTQTRIEILFIRDEAFANQKLVGYLWSNPKFGHGIEAAHVFRYEMLAGLTEFISMQLETEAGVDLSS